MELKMVGTLVNQAMKLLELIPWSDEGDTNIYPGVDEELQAAYEHLDNAMGVLQSPLAAIKEIEEDRTRPATTDRTLKSVVGD